MTLVPVVDISHHQGDVNFEKMVSHNVRGVIIRLGIGDHNDDRAAQYVPAARAAGLTVGGYWFLNPKTGATGSAQMSRFVQRASELGVLARGDLPLMIDVEDFTGEYPNPGRAGISGPPWQAWVLEAVNTIRDRTGRYPIFYSNANYMRATGLDGRAFMACDNILARYPFYSPNSPKPPADALQWERWITVMTSARPPVPLGWARWHGWQFSAGYNRMGPVYGASSTDLDLNLIQPDIWQEWTGGRTAPPVEPPVEVQPARPHTPTTPTEDEPEMPKYYVADSATKGSALVTTTIGEDGGPHYTMVGFVDGQTAEAWRGAYGSRSYSDTAYDALANGASD